MFTGKQLIGIAKRITNKLTGGEIDGMCHIISVPLCKYLLCRGMQVELIQGEVEAPKHWFAHWWIKLPDGRILDPIAGQLTGLKLPTIYIGDKPGLYTEI